MKDRWDPYGTNRFQENEIKEIKKFRVTVLNESYRSRSKQRRAYPLTQDIHSLWVLNSMTEVNNGA